MLLFAARVWPYSRVSINLSRNPFRPPPPIHTCVRDRFPVGGAQRVPWYKGKTQERKQSVNRLTSSRLNGHLSTKTALAGSQPPPHHGRPDVCGSMLVDNARYRAWPLYSIEKRRGEEREEKWGETWKCRCHRVLGWCFLSETNRVISVFYGRIRTLSREYCILRFTGLVRCSWIFQEQWKLVREVLSRRLKDLGLFDCVRGRGDFWIEGEIGIRLTLESRVNLICNLREVRQMKDLWNFFFLICILVSNWEVINCASAICILWRTIGELFPFISIFYCSPDEKGENSINVEKLFESKNGQLDWLLNRWVWFTVRGLIKKSVQSIIL